MTTTLQNLQQWLISNKLTLNAEKTSYTIFKHKNKTVPPYLNKLTFNNITIYRETYTKYLGVILDEELNWKDHIDSLACALTKICNSFKIIKHQVPTPNKINLYYAYIYSKIQYGIEVYGFATSTQLSRIQRLQNKALKILYNRDYLTPTIPLHKELRIPLVKDIYQIALLKFVHKHQTNQLPSIFNNFFTSNHQVHSYNTRQTSNLHVNHTSKHGSKLISNYATSLWNDIPAEIKNTKFTASFSKKLKNYLIKNY